MKTYKHKTKDNYYFINDTSEFIETFSINKFKNKIDVDYFNLDDKDEKKAFLKFEQKLLKKGYELLDISKEIQKKTNKLIEGFELDKDYYFLEENKKVILKSNLVKLHLKKHNDEYVLFRISSDLEDENDNYVLPTLANYVQGYVVTENDELSPQNVIAELEFYLNLLFILGYELKTETGLAGLCASKPITKETVFNAKILLHKRTSRYISIAPNTNVNCIKIVDFKIKDNTIVKKIISFTIAENETQLNEIIKAFNNPDEFKPVEITAFNKKFKENIKIEYFKKPAKKQLDLPIFPIDVPDDILEINTFFDNIIEENKYYFYANTSNENPLEWTVSFIVQADDKEDWYLYSKPFALKDFNKNVAKPKTIEISYSDDRRDFIRKQNKAFAKVKGSENELLWKDGKQQNGLKPIKTETIFEILTGKKLATLKKQKKTASFVKRNKEDILVYDVFENYACVREDSINHLYWQFFKDTSERENWLKKHQTKETELFKNEIAFINNHTRKYINQNNSDVIKIKKSYLKNPLLKHIFSDSYDIKKFTKSKLINQEGQHIKGDYVFSSPNDYSYNNKTFIIEGDLIVDGTMFFHNNSDNYIIIKGNLKARNLVATWSSNLIYVEGTIEIENITKSHHRVICENAKTNILLHEYKEALDLSSIFDYKYEVSYHSNALLENIGSYKEKLKELKTKDNITTEKAAIVKKDNYGSLSWDEERIYELLTQNKVFLKDKLENTKTDLDEYNKHKFEKRMQDWGYFYPEYAGCETLSISEDNQIKGNCIYPGGGDWVVNDLRGKSGTYGVSHEDYSICKLKVKHPEEFGIDYKQKSLKLVANAESLMNRYIQISMLYMNWAHRKTVAFTSEDKTKSNEKYQNEKQVFVEDPHLALYWINHFGATLDKRYKEVLKIIEENNLVEKLPILKEPLAFFKKTDAFYDLEIHGGYSSDKKDFKELFLIRRAYLVYWEHVFKNYNPDNLDLWWKSICIYPKVEENLIVRIRWLKNNLIKCKNWNEFDVLIKDEPKDIPLLSYIFVCNPNTSNKDKIKYADVLVAELQAHKNHFKTPHKKQFGEILLWDVRKFVSNKEKLQEAAKFYFQGNETCKEYQDIQTVLGIKNDNLKDVKNTLEKLKNAFKDYDRFDTPTEQKTKYHQDIVSILDTLTPSILIETAKNIQNHELAKRYFVYLWNTNIPNKKEALIQLFIFIEMARYDISAEIFGANFTHLIKDENDPNIEIVKAFFTIPEADFRNDSMWKNSKEAATKFFLSVAHLPKIFNYLITTVNQAPSKENKHIVNAIYTTLFSKEYDSNINPTLKFSKAQIETMLETICNWFLKYGYHADAESAIYYCANPLAEEWIKKHYNNKKWLKQFADIASYDPLDEEINDALESALEFTEDEKHNAYLEYQDEKSHKFWKITHYNGTYRVTYGKVGTDGKEIDKDFDSKEECYKASKKLVASKLKKGYKKIN